MSDNTNDRNSPESLARKVHRGEVDDNAMDNLERRLSDEELAELAVQRQLREEP